MRMIGLVFALLCASFSQAAQPPEPTLSLVEQAETSADLIRVGVRVAPPFVIESEGRYSGLAISLWEQVAAERGWKFEYRPVGLRALFDELENGELDVGVGALTVTAERESRVDFSHPFYSAGLGIAVGATQDSSAVSILARFFSWAFLAWVGGLCLLLGAIGLLAWAFERRANPEQFGGRGLSGVGSGFWWAAVTMSTVGYGDKSPVTLPGRLLGLVWMFTAIILVATFTAGITASLTVGALNGRVQGVEDLPGVRVATVQSSTSADWLSGQNINASGASNASELIEWLAQDQVDAVVYDAPILRYLIMQGYADQLSVLPGQLDPQSYAIALSPGNAERRELLNRSLLKALGEDGWRSELHQYLGRGG